MTTTTATAITTSPGASIGRDSDSLPSRYQVPHVASPAKTLSTEQRIARTFVAHGIDSSLIIQLQHIQELALAINLRGRYQITIGLNGYPDHQDISVMAKRAEASWTDTPRLMPTTIIDIRGGDDGVLHKAHRQLADVAAELMALLEEDAQ